MKTFFTKHSILFFLFIITFSIPSNAVIDYKPDAEKKTTIAKKHKKAKQKGLFKRWKEKWILKQLKKRHKKIDDKTITKKAKRSLAFGLSSVVAIIAGVLSTQTSLYLLLPIIFLSITICLAIFGFILSVSVLKKTENSKEKYKKERRKAKWGKILSLSIGIIPLLALLFILVIPK